jgi:DNA-binding PadR family transcriptional regulator
MTDAEMSIRRPTYFILSALLDQPRHGYAIIKQARELSSGRVNIAAGTLYAALDRLNTAGLIRVEREETVDGRARRYYALTDDGEAVLRAEAARLAAAARIVTSSPARSGVNARRVVKPA